MGTLYGTRVESTLCADPTLTFTHLAYKLWPKCFALRRPYDLSCTYCVLDLMVRRDVRGDLDSTQFWYYTFSIFGSIFRNLPHHRILDSALCVFKFRCYKFAQSTFFGILKEICCCVFLHFICSSKNRTHHIEIYCSALCSNPKKYQIFFNAINSAESHERVVNLLLVFACLFGIPQNIYMWIRHVAPNRLFSLA